VSSERNSGPSLINSVLEFRAGLEACALPYAYPLLLRAKRGRGRPVLLIPGFTSSDNATYFVRDYLRRLGYDVYGWGLGASNGLSADTFKKLEQRLADISSQTGQKVSLVGWSLGGFYVRALANKSPGLVRNIVTVGTTFSMPTPKAVNRVINRLYGHLNPYQQMDEFFQGSDLWEPTPVVPSTSIYTRGDGVNNWQYCLDKVGALSENVRICGSHSGMAINPLVYHVVADRLSQDVECWQMYKPPKILQGLTGATPVAG
jgi:pimeloyl-ACP methyl ester carboxylesterase